MEDRDQLGLLSSSSGDEGHRRARKAIEEYKFAAIVKG